MRVRAGVCLLAVAACGRIDFDPLSGGGALPSCVPDGDPAARSTLTLDRHRPGTALIDFPLLVVLDDTRTARVLLDDGAGLRFRQNGCVVPHEIEQLGAAGGDPMLVWVRVSRFDDATELTVEYGGAPDVASPARVWTPSYEGVWHLAEGAALDASEHARDGTPVGDLAINPGHVGTALELDDTDREYVAVPAAASVSLPRLTVSAWVTLDAPSLSTSGFSTIVTREYEDTDRDDFLIGVNGQGRYVFGLATNATDGVVVGPAFAFGAWTHVAGTWDGVTARLYVDGELRAESDVAGAALTASPTPVFLGAGRNKISSGPRSNADDDYANGIVDEVRLESTARSAAWIAADVASTSDAVITYGAIEMLH